jgi:hypothetical protein
VARKIEVVIAGDAASLEKALGRAGGATTKFAKQTEGAHKRIGSALSGAIKYAAGAALAYGTIAGARSAITTTEDLAKTTLTLHKSFGLSIESASRWAAVAKARGSDGKSLTMGFKALATQTNNVRNAIRQQGGAVDALRGKQALALKQAVAEGKSAADLTKLKQSQSLALDTASKKSLAQVQAFKQLGISQHDLVKHGQDMNWVLRAVSDGMTKLPAGTEKAAIMAKLFGRTWIAIAPLIRSGSKAMDEQLKLADKYGVTFHGHTVKSLQELIQAQRESKLATMGLDVAFGTLLAPALTKAIQGFATFIANLRSGGGTFAQVRSAASGVASAVGSVVHFFQQNRTAAVALTTTLGAAAAGFVGFKAAMAISGAITAVVSGFKALRVAVIAINLAVRANPFVFVAAAIIAVGAALVIAYKRSETFRTVVNAAFSSVKSVVVGAITIILGQIKLHLKALQVLLNFAGKLPGPLGKPFRSMADAVGGAIDKLSGLQRSLNSLPQQKRIQVLVDVLNKPGPNPSIGGKPGKLAHQINKNARGASLRDAGGGGGFMFGTDADIASAQAAQEALQQQFQAQDDARQEKSLRNALARAQKAKKGIADATNALRDFSSQEGRARALSVIEVKLKGFQQVKAFKDAIGNLRKNLSDLAGQAASVWRTQQEAAIASGPLAQQLAALKATDAAQDDARTALQLQQALADAVAAGDVKAQKDAQDAIDAYTRSKQEDAIQAQIDAQIVGLATQEENYQATLNAQLAALANNLQDGTIMYKQFAQDVNAILSQYGLAFDGSPDEEQAISGVNAPQGAARPKATRKPKRKKRAVGGSVGVGTYRVGELGPEDVTITGSRSGMVTQASQSRNRGGDLTINYNAPVTIGSTRAAERLANRLAWRLTTGALTQ